MQKFVLISCCAILSVLSPAFGQNLIVNPDGELPPAANGWIEAAGTWWASNQVPAHNGSYHFYAGTPSPNTVGAISELYQDVNVSANAGLIDAGLSSYTFTGWMRIFNKDFFGNPNDEAKIIVEYRNAASVVLSSYNTGYNTALVWTQYTDTRSAPAGTRTIRIRLISTMLKTTDSDGYIDDLSLVSNVTAPVSLIGFEANQTQNSVQLRWSTASEENNNYFTIQRSADAVHWENILNVPGSGNSPSIRNYVASDEQPIRGLVYYRLRQTDYDGNYTDSKTVSLKFDFSGMISVYPNPASSDLYINNGGVPETTVSFMTTSGEFFSLPFSQSGGIMHFDISSLGSGLYFIQIRQASGLRVEKLLVE